MLQWLIRPSPERLAASTGGMRTWYGTDGQGSVRQTLDDSGSVLGMQSYDPYGRPETGSTLVSSFGYTGELQNSSTGAEYLRARWYQPGTGQMLGMDPLVASTGQPYAYGADNPSLFKDPSGLIPQFGWNCFKPDDKLIDGTFQGHDFAESFYLWRKASQSGACELQIPRAAYSYWTQWGEKSNTIPSAFGIADVVENVNGGNSNLWEFAPSYALLNQSLHERERKQAAFYVWRAAECPMNLPVRQRMLWYGGFGFTTPETEWNGPRTFWPGDAFGQGSMISPPVWFQQNPGYIYTVLLSFDHSPGVVGFKFFRWKVGKERQAQFQARAPYYATQPASDRVPREQMLKDYWEPYLGNNQWGKAPRTFMPASQTGTGLVNSSIAAGAGIVGAVISGVLAAYSFISGIANGQVLGPASTPI